MDLGIAGRWALVCASSAGLGRGCAQALAKEGVNLVINGRNEQKLAMTRNELLALNPALEVRMVAGDITQASVRAEFLAAAPHVDILVNNAGGPRPDSYANLTTDDWHDALNNNMITPIELIRECLPDMISRGFGRVINITSMAVKAPVSVLGLSNGARAGLTGFVSGVAREAELAANNVTINNILPGAFDTDRILKTMGIDEQTSAEEAQRKIEARYKTIPARRFGKPEEFGALCAFLCSQQAAYMTGQNLLIDGGAYPGTF
ncbi:SDR family oxidoreductase [Pseudomonas sp. F1_0610]|uniref:SDR family oxidoreductase n=1 Tax=Pseudomonas sp. F1_0610 TaxID=3114284 RepID=UPI0039C320A8